MTPPDTFIAERTAPAASETTSSRLACFVCDLTYDALPEVVAAKTKLLLLDTVGVCAGSARLDFGRAMTAQCIAWGGRGDCTVIGDDRRVPAHLAAFANGALGHGQDFDDTHTESIVHPSCVLVPAALAAAERHDRPGAEMVAALAGVTEAVLRLALPAGGAINRRGFQATSSLGAFGSALISARVGGLGLDRMVQSVGIAGSFSSGLMECVPAAAESKQFQPGWGGLCGVMAADLAAAGFTGPRTVIEGPLGYYAAFLHGMDLDRDRTFRGLGETWDILDVRPKLYPCAHNVHGSIECAAALRARGVEAARIVSVLVEPPQGAVPMVCEPWARKIAPATGYDARFSLPYAVAVMLVTGAAGIASFTDDLAHDPLIRHVMARTRYRVNPDFQFRDMPGRVTVEMEDGKAFTEEVGAVRGHAETPIGTDELMAKFRANTEWLGPERSGRVANMILSAETLPTIRTLMAELRPTA